MDNDFSASASGKTATGTASGTTPFDQIAALEKQENARVQKELDAMERERREVEQAVKEKEEAADLELKENARKDLVEYRETELSTIITAAEKEAEKEAEKLEDQYASREAAVARKLTEQFLAEDSPVFRS